jgi:hypothetical protein
MHPVLLFPLKKCRGWKRSKLRQRGYTRLLKIEDSILSPKTLLLFRGLGDAGRLL